MSNTFTLLQRFNPAGLHDAAKGWRQLSAAAEDAENRHRHQVNGPLRHSHWQGKDADSAFYAMERTEQVLEILRVEAESAALVLDTVADRMDQAKTNLLNALRRADEWQLPVSDDGTVGLPQQAAADRHDPDAQTERQNQVILRNQVQERINAALTAAQEASDQGAHALGRLDASILTQPRTFGAAAESAQDAKDVARDLGLAAPYIPENKDPKQAADWWKSLTPEQQRSYLALHPEEVGRLDGLPSTVRDEANRLVLEQQLDALHAGDPRHSDLTYEQYNKRENALRALKDHMDQRDGEDEQHQLFLLGLDPKGDGRAIVSTGNPDTADHTAVLVPGTATTLESMPGQIDRIDKLQNAAERSAKPGEKVAVISWLGYDAPEIPPESLGVAGTGRAEDGAADMRRFTEGVRVVQGDHHSHLTVIGHSYGTTAVGIAAQGGGGLHADDIIGVASPGMGTNNANNLNVDPGPRLAGHSPGRQHPAGRRPVPRPQPHSRELRRQQLRRRHPRPQRLLGPRQQEPRQPRTHHRRPATRHQPKRARRSTQPQR
ncbi:alpha/beta hydrolase family protein [Streptomyces sp. TLI_235]|nr:alpha/beta hydrolase [Streptomyces sp. TLI_235]PBC71055.1 alpha/beta hydrolase family protein [Streptomyces sp. TLI_235]